MGDARRAFQIVRESVYRPTAAGRQLANKNFYNMSMAVTDTTIGGFIALANRNRKVVESNGDTVTDAGMVQILLGGLLEEFDPIKLIIEQNPAITLRDACDKLEDYAAQHKLTHLTKGGDTHKRAKTFHGAEDQGEKKHRKNPVQKGISYYDKPWIGSPKDCQHHHMGKCPRGGKCPYPPCFVFSYPTSRCRCPHGRNIGGGTSILLVLR